MIKDIVEAKLAGCGPTERIYKLTVCRNELNDMIKEFEQEWTWCSKCQTYEKNSESKTTKENNRTILRCSKCNEILKFLN